jgi:hypothetical protein
LNGTVAILDQIQKRLQESVRLGPNARNFGRHMPSHYAFDLTPRRFHNNPEIIQHLWFANILTCGSRKTKSPCNQ